MDALSIIEKYYKKDSEIYNILVSHSSQVMTKALNIAKRHPEFNIDIEFVKEAAMLHDIGIFLVQAPKIHCHGNAPYICHGYLGREILDMLGYHRHALVCDRHTGTGISLEQIVVERLPLPFRDMQPESIEEKLICYVDCFFSKTHLGKEKSIDRIQKSLAKHGKRSLDKFDEWKIMFA